MARVNGFTRKYVSYFAMFSPCQLREQDEYPSVCYYCNSCDLGAKPELGLNTELVLRKGTVIL